MRPIDADELEHMLRTDFDTLYETVFDTIQRVPTIGAVPVKRGHWESYYIGGDDLECIECSECGEVYDSLPSYNYCPNCGADMRGEQDG